MLKDSILKKMDSAYGLLARVTVNGENVDLLAMARQELREAFHLMKALEEVKKDG